MKPPIEILENDFIKYLKCIYCAKKIEIFDNNKYRLHYYYRSIEKETSVMSSNSFVEIWSHHIKYIKKANVEEKNFLISKIKKVNPGFITTNEILDNNRYQTDLKELDCIEYLKSKGYLVYKQC